MRFSLLQAFNQGLQGMLRVQAQTLNTQNQISTGRRVLTPADDPVAAARILQLNQGQSQLTQFVKNADSAESRLSLEEVQLESVSNILVRVRELTVNAGNGTLSQRDRQSIAAELETRLDELLSIANTRDSSGNYIFAGFQGGVKPFAETATNVYSYFGDEGQRLVQIANATLIPLNDSGKAIFEDIPTVRNTFRTSAHPGNSAQATAGPGLVTDQALYDSASYHEDYFITVNPGNAYSVVEKSTGAVIAGGTYTPGQPITVDLTASRGWQVTISGTPAVGDTFFVESTEKQSLLNTVGRLTAGLNTLSDSSADQAVLSALLAETLDNIGNAEDNISSVRAVIGARQNTIDSVREVNSGVQLVNQQVLSDIRDLDYAEALSRLTLETFTLEAAQQSFAKVSRLSLFNFLR